MKKSIVALLLAVTLIGGCTNGCGTLDPQGVYQGDKFLYDADLTITTGYEVMHRFVTWEYQNRETLKGTPGIKAAADKVRAGAKDWVSSALKLRDAYKADPTDTNRKGLQKALDVIRQAVVEATGYLATREVKPENP